MPGNGSVLGNHTLGNATIKVLTSSGDAVDIIPIKIEPERNKFRFTYIEGGTKTSVVGHEVKNKRRK